MAARNPKNAKTGKEIQLRKSSDSSKYSNLGENWIFFDNIGFPIYFAILLFTFEAAKLKPLGDIEQQHMLNLENIFDLSPPS